MKLSCECGFEGSPRPHTFKGTVFTKCPGCDTIYRVERCSSTCDACTDSRFYRQDGIPLTLFDNFDDAEKWLKLWEGAKQSKVQPKKKKVPFDPAHTVMGPSKDPDTVYQTLHFYQRDLDSLAGLRKDAQEERALRGTSVFIFTHNHKFGEECTSSCREEQ